MNRKPSASRTRSSTERNAESAANAAWLNSLPSDQKTIADIAVRLHSNFIRPNHFTGGCYLLAFFLRQYLFREHDIDARAIVGYACDGTSPLRMSHAWLELGGKKTDVSLTITEFPEHQIPGALLVHDRELQRGNASYTYHLSQSPESLAKIRAASEYSPGFRAVNEMKEQEHREMLARAADDSAMNSFLAMAPPQVSYLAMARAVQRD